MRLHSNGSCFLDARPVQLLKSREQESRPEDESARRYYIAKLTIYQRVFTTSCVTTALVITWKSREHDVVLEAAAGGQLLGDHSKDAYRSVIAGGHNSCVAVMCTSELVAQRPQLFGAADLGGIRPALRMSDGDKTEASLAPFLRPYNADLE